MHGVAAHGNRGDWLIEARGPVKRGAGERLDPDAQRRKLTQRAAQRP
ncbi:hypothetical protein [Truepera radiovictrix]|nr:hypothetical protein [Truepera radiovictrix]WMT58687.1 hypothetical protein RCV51_07005 [Truepera radiovictrix]